MIRVAKDGVIQIDDASFLLVQLHNMTNFRLTNLFYIAIADFISTTQNFFRMIMFSYAIA